MDGDPLIAFEAEGTVSSAHVAVLWTRDEDDSPEVVIGGCSTFEAYGLLSAALGAIRRELERSIELPGELLVDPREDDDEG